MLRSLFFRDFRNLEDATWSPDGSKIAFLSDRVGNTEIYMMDSNGSGQISLTNSTGDEGTIDWSPGGSKIAFRTDRDGDLEIYIMDANGSNPINLTRTTGIDTFPLWKP